MVQRQRNMYLKERQRRSSNSDGYPNGLSEHTMETILTKSLSKGGTYLPRYQTFALVKAL